MFHALVPTRDREADPVEELLQRYDASTLEEAFFAATGRRLEDDEEDDDREVFA